MSSIFSNTSGMEKIKRSNIVSKQRYNREYLLSNDTAKELNTYIGFDPFPVFNDSFSVDINDKNEEDYSGYGPGTPGVRSIFNKAGAIVIGSSTGNLNIDITDGNTVSEWRISNNIPLIDSPEARKRIRINSGCSVKELVKASELGLLGRNTYSYSDFMYCKHLGKMPNNHLITLRRFPLPVDDYISTLGETSRIDQDITSKNAQSIGCMVTWLGTAGNEINNILNYSYNMPFKPQKAELHEQGTDADANGGILNGIAAAFDSTYRKEYKEGMASNAFNKVVSKYFKVDLGDSPYPASQYKYFKDSNKVYGPVDVIKDTYMRSDEGLSFSQSFTLVFDYELRSYNGINGRQAMLDLLSNIFNVTYSTGTFWGGGYRGGGAHQNNIFANMEIFKANGGVTEYWDAFTKDYSKVTESIGLSLKGKKPMELIKGFMNEIGGMLLAGKLNSFGRPHKQMVNSILSPAPIGFWHITIGNPHHPIISMGNMILKSTKIEHYGPLGIDDFPTGIKVTCEFDRGKTRDIRDLEKIYMHGNDRIGYSMGPKIFDMYKYAKEYKGESKASAYKGPNDEMLTNPQKWNMDITNNKYNKTLKKYFGHTDTYSIYVAATEQEYGAHKTKPSAKSGPSSGDSSASGNVLL